MATNIPAGSTNDAILQLQKRAVFSTHKARRSTIGLMQGHMPTQADAESNIKGLSAADMPIVVTKELTSTRGSRIQTKFVQPVTSKPIMGDKIAQGKGAALVIDTGEFIINQVRYPMSVGSKMSQQRTEIDLYSLAKTTGVKQMDSYADETILVHLAGARGSQSSGAWTVPLESDPEFDEILINPVKAPTRNRHYVSTSSGVELFYNGSVNEPASTSVLSLDVIDALVATMTEMDHPPLPIKFQDDDAANDSPIHVLMVSPTAMASFKQSNSRHFQTWQSQAYQRSPKNPVFTRGSLLYNNVLIVESQNKFVRFNIGSTLNYCAAYGAETETGHTVAIQAGYALDRALLIGAQALSMAYGGVTQGSESFFWEEEITDFKNQREVVIGMITGCAKNRFAIDHGGSIGTRWTDMGVIALDVPVKIT